MPDLMSFVPAFLAALLSLFLTPLAIAIARRRGWFDDSNDPRKIHTGQIPRLGGPAMSISFLASLVVLQLSAGTRPETRLLVPMAGGLVLHLVGLFDDFRDLRARLKLFAQLIVAIATVAAGYSFSLLPLPFFAEPLQLGIWGKLLTVIWITGIANAVNMIDGMDGLAGGISLIAAASFGAMQLSLGHVEAAAAAFALAGAITGFLFFNFPTARIFMGDSGSLFLGYVLAILPLLGSSGEPEGIGLLSAATILAVPIFDVFAAIIRRQRRGEHVMAPDREHLHHKLMDFGLDARQILALVYAVCIGLGTVAAAGTLLDPAWYFGLMVAALIALLGTFIYLHYAKERVRNNA